MATTEFKFPAYNSDMNWADESEQEIQKQLESMSQQIDDFNDANSSSYVTEEIVVISKKAKKAKKAEKNKFQTRK